MGDKTGIEWTDATWTPIRARNTVTGAVGWHCEHASDGCRFCYAESINRRLGTGIDFKRQHRDSVSISLDKKMLLAPLRWKKPRMIFVCSMTDLFADFVSDAMIDRLFAVMALCPQHTFQVLTKRADRMMRYILSRSAMVVADAGLFLGSPLAEAARHVSQQAGHPAWMNAPVTFWNAGNHEHPVEGWPLPNVWLGVSAEDQANADRRIPYLMDTPAAVRWVSLEPLLGPIDLMKVDVARGLNEARGRTPHEYDPDTRWPLLTPFHHMQSGSSFPGIDWVVVGGESGRCARPMHPDWARDLRDQCAAGGVPFLFKQWGEFAPSIDGTRLQEAGGTVAPFVAWPDGSICHGSADEHGGPGIKLDRIGKKAAGRLLDGVLHDGYPTVAP